MAHRQYVGLAFRRSRVRTSLGAASLAICSPHLHSAIRGAQEVPSSVGWGVTQSQLNLPSLETLSVADCGRLQMGAPHWVTSVALLLVVYK